MNIVYPGLFFTASICWLVAFFGFLVSLAILQASPRRKTEISFGLFWLLFSFVWFFIGLRHFFASIGSEELDRIFYIVGQIFIFLHLPPAGYYIYLKLFKKIAVATSFGIFFLALALAGIWSVFQFGIIIGPKSDFTTEYAPNWLSLLFFRIMLLLGLTLFYYHFFYWIFKLIRRRKMTEFASFLASFSVVIYGTLGYIDEKGLMKDWPLVFFRLCYLFAVFLAYLSQTLKRTSQNR